MGKLGEGAFGVVYMSQHKHTKMRFAVKVMQRQKIDSVYGKNEQPFEELAIAEEVARYDCENILEPVETF